MEKNKDTGADRDMKAKELWDEVDEATKAVENNLDNSDEGFAMLKEKFWMIGMRIMRKREKLF